jgi:hypothetical protein
MKTGPIDSHSEKSDDDFFGVVYKSGKVGIAGGHLRLHRWENDR